MTTRRLLLRAAACVGTVASLACDDGRSPAPSPAAASRPAARAAPATFPATAPIAMHANRLAREKSPYLLQHAHNPVDWYPWGEEAFKKARDEKKPIFLSVGYSTCHWCHVMERESFEDEAVAGLLNETCVPIKVDREERPDVDRVYMTYVQATTGGGGWPMTVFLTPDLEPFFGGTYFPPRDADGMTGLTTLLHRVHEVWTTQHDDVVATSKRVAAALRADTAAAPGAPGDGPATRPATAPAVSSDAAFDDVARGFDKANGGFGRAPKFPEPVRLRFLMQFAATTPDAARRDAARGMVYKTLRAMAAGGIHDQIGGGFHRYSTDARWFLPHFEKMLYDQAQIAAACLDAHQASGDAFFADTARNVFDYVLREMTGPEGRFYCAEDADSAADAAEPAVKSEGAFYVWTADEITKLLGTDDAAIFSFHYGVKPTGNVAIDPRRELVGKNVLYEARSIAETAEHFRQPADAVAATLASARTKLMAARASRPRPHLDDKTLASWNGLMISALARGGRVLREPRYTDAATRAAAFVRDNLYDPASRTLSRSWRGGRSDVGGFLDDYSFCTAGFLDLYESTLDAQWLRLALALQAKQDELFADPAGGGYFTTPGGDKNLMLRLKDDGDNVEPAGNSVAALNLLRLSQMTDDKAPAARAAGVFACYAAQLREHPSSLPAMLVAWDFAHSVPRQIVIAGDPAAADTRALLDELFRHDVPNRIVLGADGGAGQAFLAARLDFIKEMKPVGGKATAYVCQNHACRQPVNDAKELAAILVGANDAVPTKGAGPAKGE